MTDARSTEKRAMLLAHLELAKNHVALGEQHLASQRKLIAELVSKGLPTAAAEALLYTFEQAQVQHLYGVRRIEQQLKTRIPHVL